MAKKKAKTTRRDVTTTPQKRDIRRGRSKKKKKKKKTTTRTSRKRPTAGMTTRSNGETYVVLDALKPHVVPIDDLNIDSANARSHNDRNIGTIKAALARFGQHRPAVVQKKGNVVRVGNGMLQAARDLGWTHIAAIFVDETDVEATARAISDNRTAELADWEGATLSQLLNDLKKEGALDGVGFDQKEIDALIEKAGGREAGTGQLGDFEYRIIVLCEDEKDQATKLRDLEERGIACRAEIL